MVAFIDQHRATYGVEPICAVLPIALSTYFLQKAQDHDPTTRSAGAQRDEELRAAIQRVWDEHQQVYGPRKVWPSCGASRSTSRAAPSSGSCAPWGCAALCVAAPGLSLRAPTPPARPADLVERQFTATRPNQLWVADFTYVATWRGFVYVAFVIDVFARRIVGWRVSSSLATDFVLDALEQAIYDRRGDLEDLVHHSDRGTQYLSMRYTERLADADIAPSVGSRGDSYDSAMAESIIGLFKTEVIHLKGPWRHLEAVEFATLTWVDWLNSVDCSNRLATCRRRSMKRRTMRSWMPRPPAS
jgi:transposase InsO family protein